MKGDVLWMEENEVVVEEVDPIRGTTKVTLANHDVIVVGAEKLTLKKYEPVKVHVHKRRRSHQEPKATSISVPSSPVPEPQHQQAAAQAQVTSSTENFEFTVFVKEDGSVLKVGSLCFVESCTFPFIITRLFKPNLSGSVFVSGVRCVCKDGKVVSLLEDFQVTVKCSFVRPCSSGQFCLSCVSSAVSSFIFGGQSQVCVC